MNCQNEYFNTCSNFTYCESNECLQHNESMQNTIDQVKLCLQSLQRDEEVRFLSCFNIYDFIQLNFCLPNR